MAEDSAGVKGGASRRHADYLVNNGAPRKPADLQKAESLMRQAHNLDPGDGRIAVELGKTLLLADKKQEAAKFLEIGINFTADPRTRREALALLASLGALPEQLQVIAAAASPAEKTVS